MRFCTGSHIVQLVIEGSRGVSGCSAGGDEDGGACSGADVSSGDGNSGYEDGIAKGNVLAIAWGGETVGSMGLLVLLALAVAGIENL